MNKVTREKDEKFIQMIKCLTNTLEPVDMANVHKHLSNLWALDEINYKYTDNNPHKKQKNSMMDSAMESKINNNVKSNSNFPRMTRAGSKILINRMQSNKKPKIGRTRIRSPI